MIIDNNFLSTVHPTYEGDSLITWKIQCESWRSNFPSQSDTPDFLRAYKERVETTQREFASAADEIEYENVKCVPGDVYGGGGVSNAKAGVKNEMLVFVYSKIKKCLFYIQNMIDIKSADQRVAETAVFVWAKWHVRVRKQSCKQTNRLILWGRQSTKIFFSSIFFNFF